ncbi:AAA family ATPase [Nesterenkonia sphaerica]|uniref:ATP-binding protein n=1 Tax=Nesterenkonia sphaerica TaxID=1804988 RepID=A0A5R9A6R5_9MICC|nr:ATP-binding protein [Nesterenkonia sphaerica]TLP74200.1 ATP-binding protein [Nesterenkonia sphaerica]
MNNWYVITGGPSSGKTTTVQLLQQLGYTTTIEHARHYIDLKRAAGRTVLETRANQAEFQRGVLDMQLQQEASLNPEKVVFLDRALPDSLAYYRFLGLEPDPRLLEAIQEVSYRKVFILDLLPLASDYARTEDVPAQRRIHDLLTEVYLSLPVPVQAVPALSPQQRVEFILDHLIPVDG